MTNITGREAGLYGKAFGLRNVRLEIGSYSIEKHVSNGKSPAGKNAPVLEELELELTWEDALDAAEDRDGWRKRIARCAAQHGTD